MIPLSWAVLFAGTWDLGSAGAQMCRDQVEIKAPRRAKVAESSGWLMKRDFPKMDMNH